MAIEQVLEASPQAIDPVVRGIVGNGTGYSACDAYKAEYLRAELARQIAQRLAPFDALVVPTAPTIRTWRRWRRNRCCSIRSSALTPISPTWPI